MPINRLFDYWESRSAEKSLLSGTAQDLVGASWRERTELNYGSAWKQWCEFCAGSGICATSPALTDVMNYLGFLYDKGLKYRTINCARSALSSTLLPFGGFKVGQHPLITRMMKGIYNSRPPLPKRCSSWSVMKVLEMLRTWGPASSLDLKTLTLKTVMLLALACSKRVSSLAMLSVNSKFCEISENYIKLQPIGLEKHSRPGLISTPVKLDSFKKDIRIDPVYYLKSYIEKTKNIRTSEQLFVTHNKPHKSASVASLARWIAQVITHSGQSGSGGSVRSVSTSYALAKGASLASVIEAGDWARVSTFKKFYYHPVPLSFMQHVLN